MEPLKDDTRRWLDEAMRDEAMPAEDRSRLWGSISSTIDPSAPIGNDLDAKPGLLDRAVQLRHVVGIAAIVFTAGVVAGHALWPTTTVVTAPAPSAQPVPVVAPTPVVSIAPVPTVSSTAPAIVPPVTPTTGAPPARSAANGDPSMDEVRAIITAKRALAEGRPADALVALEGHERSFPHGSLAEERDALRVLALCAAGRATEGATERAAFLRAHPFSAYVDRVRAACVQ